jgi:hypothetical protein
MMRFLRFSIEVFPKMATQRLPVIGTPLYHHLYCRVLILLVCVICSSVIIFALVALMHLCYILIGAWLDDWEFYLGWFVELYAYIWVCYRHVADMPSHIRTLFLFVASVLLCHIIVILFRFIRVWDHIERSRVKRPLIEWYSYMAYANILYLSVSLCIIY